jgi:hypothetical protein
MAKIQIQKPLRYADITPPEGFDPPPGRKIYTYELEDLRYMDEKRASAFLKDLYQKAAEGNLIILPLNIKILNDVSLDKEIENFIKFIEAFNKDTDLQPSQQFQEAFKKGLEGHPQNKPPTSGPPPTLTATTLPVDLKGKSAAIELLRKSFGYEISGEHADIFTASKIIDGVKKVVFTVTPNQIIAKEAINDDPHVYRDMIRAAIKLYGDKTELVVDNISDSEKVKFKQALGELTALKLIEPKDTAKFKFESDPKPTIPSAATTATPKLPPTPTSTPTLHH